MLYDLIYPEPFHWLFQTEYCMSFDDFTENLKDDSRAISKKLLSYACMSWFVSFKEIIAFWSS